jgi:hypothetical protein
MVTNAAPNSFMLPETIRSSIKGIPGSGTTGTTTMRQTVELKDGCAVNDTAYRINVLSEPTCSSDILTHGSSSFALATS